jgi:hypothetical protein
MTNKYLLASSFFIVWLLFFDHNDFFLQFKRNHELKEVREKADFTVKESPKLRKKLMHFGKTPLPLKGCPGEILMKKDNEDLFVIAEK